MPRLSHHRTARAWPTSAEGKYSSTKERHCSASGGGSRKGVNVVVVVVVGVLLVVGGGVGVVEGLVGNGVWMIGFRRVLAPVEAGSSGELC